MKHDLSKEYRDYLKEETPDLWSRIEEGLTEYSAVEDRIQTKKTEAERRDFAMKREKKNSVLIKRMTAIAAGVCVILAVGVTYQLVSRRTVLQDTREETQKTTVAEPGEEKKPADVKTDTDKNDNTDVGTNADTEANTDDGTNTDTEGDANVNTESGINVDTETDTNTGTDLNIDTENIKEQNPDTESYIVSTDEDGLYQEEYEVAEEAAYEVGIFDSNMMLAAPMAVPAPAMVGSGGWDMFGSRKGDGETYAAVEENGFSLVKTQPLSTFSADVDTASYANVRRMIEDGYQLDEINPDAVRAEEFLNYFRYDLVKPQEGEKFGVTTQIAACPWNEKHQLLMVGISTEDIDLSEAPAENLTFLLDVSGSMADEDKLPLVQKAFGQLIDQLDEDDTVSLVTYANGVEVLLDGVSGSDKTQIRKAIDSLEAAGGTYGEGGIQKAYALAEANYKEDGNNRILLATDGDLNIGISEPEELEKLITQKKESGIYLSVLGFGYGNIRDDNMERLADCGNGNYSYIDSLLEARKVLVEEMGATFHTVAEDVKLQVEFNPQRVNAYRLIGYENRMLEATDFTDDTKDAGELGAGHSVIALYELIPADAADAVTLKYQQTEDTSGTVPDGNEKGAYANEYATLKIRYKEPGEDSSVEQEKVIDDSCLTLEPDDSFTFASLVAEFAMILGDSQNKGNSSLAYILDTYKTLEDTDDYKEEFYHLVWMLNKNLE
ncbi:MAG: von Willebrand factor type A domain-containing protein [Blautia sp.]|nr:von Willebrand factor type A domain-containing protein [Blautia sp.]